ncbi:MAG: ECF transporter S component [Clostridia bacterium]|nr:ECF transporter S component [Clostridia bacterium]
MKTVDKRIKIRYLAGTGILSGVAYVLMLLEFSTPLTPSFLKFDFSELPAFIAAFAYGPVSGVAVELIKNLIHLPFTGTSGVGELANFIIGACMVFPAGLFYKYRKTRRGALAGCVIGTAVASAVSFPVNYFITYPFYQNFMPLDVILKMYSAIIPAADTLEKALLMVNLPFTFAKGLIGSALTFAVYKYLSPILHGRADEKKATPDTPSQDGDTDRT